MKSIINDKSYDMIDFKNDLGSLADVLQHISMLQVSISENPSLSEKDVKIHLDSLILDLRSLNVFSENFIKNVEFLTLSLLDSSVKN